MTTLSIEDLKAWLALLPKVTPGPWVVDGDTLLGSTEHAPLADPISDLRFWHDPFREANAAHIAKCDPATIAALIEGYIAMAEALSTFMDEHDSTYDGDPLSEGMSVFISKARSALNIGGTND